MAETATLSQTATNAKGGNPPDKVGFIPIGKIRLNPVALRPVDKENEDYLSLVDSVRKRGVLIPILVREIENPENAGEVNYGLIDGLQRYNAACDAGLSEIKAAITTMDQADVEETQIIANAQRIETKPVQYATAIERLLQRNPTMPILELAGRLSKSTTWIYKMLGMVKRLHESIKPLVDEQKINLSNAIELAKLPTDEQPQWVDKAQTMDSGEFTASVATRVKSIKEDRRKGRAESPPQFEPVAHARKWAEVKAEYQNGGPNLLSLVRRQQLTDPTEIVKLVLAWTANMDPDSQAQQRMDHDAREKKRAEEADRKKLERTAQKEQEAQKTRAELEAKIKAKDAENAAAAATTTA